MPEVADRAGVLVIRAGRVALIERRRGSAHYFVAPGGGIDSGEAPAEAAVREAREELGLDVVLVDGPHTIDAVGEPRRHQHYWFAMSESDVFGPMTGPEQASATNAYERVWFPIERLDSIDLRPAGLADVIRRGAL